MFNGTSIWERGRRIHRILRPRLFNDVHLGLSKGIGVKHVAEEPGSHKQGDENGDKSPVSQ